MRHAAATYYSTNYSLTTAVAIATTAALHWSSCCNLHGAYMHADCTKYMGAEHLLKCALYRTIVLLYCTKVYKSGTMKNGVST